MTHHSFPGRLVAGVDEVGRGPLAGDVVASAVILGEIVPEGITDSKKLSERRRESLFGALHEHALAIGIGRASVAEIDAMNILAASLLAMERAVASLSLTPDVVLVDGNRLPDWAYESYAVVGGDAREPTIGAASIIAKVTRDREMVSLDERYPGYGLAGHKGYPTKAHLQALHTLGVSPIHRRSFAPVARLLGRPEVG